MNLGGVMAPIHVQSLEVFPFHESPIPLGYHFA